MSRAALDLRLFLERLTRHSRLTEPEQQIILDLPTASREFEANRDVVRPGDVVGHACVVIDGMVGRFRQTEDGLRQITAIHVPGDAPDLHSVVLPSSTFALQALTASRLLFIPHGALREAGHRYPAIAEAFWRDCMIDAAILAEWVTNVGRRNAKARIAHLICELAMRSRVPTEQGTAFPLPLTQTHLADATGLTSVHVNRTLRALKESGLAQVQNREARVMNWKALASAGDFQPDYLYGRG